MDEKDRLVRLHFLMRCIEVNSEIEEVYIPRYEADDKNGAMTFEEALDLLPYLIEASPFVPKEEELVNTAFFQTDQEIEVLKDIEKLRFMEDQTRLALLIERSKKEKVARETLRCLLKLYRQDSIEIPDKLNEWALDMAESESLKYGPRTVVRDEIIHDLVMTLNKCGMKKSANDASEPKSACHAVAKVVGMTYDAVVKAVANTQKLLENKEL